MFGFAVLKRSEYQRPFWLTVALSVMLLVSVSITVAQAANPARLGNEIRRDLGALRAQLELIDPSERDAGRQTVAFNTDLGDGGPVFQRHSMVTIVAGANRRLERLLESDRAQGGDARVHAAEFIAYGDVRSAAPDRSAGARRRSGGGGGGARAHRGVAGSLRAGAGRAARPDDAAREHCPRSRRRTPPQPTAPRKRSALLRRRSRARAEQFGQKGRRPRRGRCYAEVNAPLLWRRPAIPPRPARRGCRRPRPPCC